MTLTPMRLFCNAFIKANITSGIVKYRKDTPSLKQIRTFFLMGVSDTKLQSTEIIGDHVFFELFPLVLITNPSDLNML